MILIRKLQKKDIPACVKIAKLLWENYPEVGKNIRKELQNPSIKFAVAITDNDKKVIGFTGWTWSNCNHNLAEFVWVNVLPEYQNFGVGQNLTEWRLKEIKKAGGRAVIVTTHLPTVFEKYGFSTLGVYPWYLSDKTHLMIKELI